MTHIKQETSVNIIIKVKCYTLRIFKAREQRRFEQEHNPNYLKFDRKKKNPVVENIDGIPVTQIDLSVPLHVPGNNIRIFG